MNFSREYHPQWTVTEKILFRFLFLYFALFIVLRFMHQPAEPLVRLVGHHVLNLKKDLSYFPTGSGDSTYAYVLLFLNALLASTCTTIWTLADRRRPAYNTLFYWFLVILRFFLAMMLLSYGFAKVYKTQFPEPSLLRLLQPLGNFSPMGLAWTYMGFSEAYNVYTGMLEVVGGLLLIWRKTTTLGALLTVGVMSHIVVMNFTYDIPVKLFSLHLLVMALILASTDRKRLYRIFFSNRSTASLLEYNPVKNKLFGKIKVGLKLTALILFTGISIWQGYNAEREYGDKRAKPTLYGIWEVETMHINDSLIPPLLTNEQRWRYLVVDWKERATLKYITDEIKFMTLEVDSSKSEITLYEGEWKQEQNFKYSIENDTLYLKGKLYGDNLEVKLKAKNKEDFLLTNRGFHWINEYPLNR
ncbi:MULTISPECIES: hypothetical protein [unclassified Leeuwenhoekiella]|uniref:hypothetical protein n=1 Tax=unclassified Leeuwenhoekiella TaxID=2615029 RepID=UPI000C3D1B7E|nr:MULTISPECIES: hypothetical protein [unclassified Leeuwenhoekiella]MBA82478.1 hypothetical protein [Leeuwenhoekiella sp.]|tara:strand:+ start:3346 stop:4590 length:1245 start_codon:yes stop_codon:yes gene_type:complete